MRKGQDPGAVYISSSAVNDALDAPPHAPGVVGGEVTLDFEMIGSFGSLCTRSEVSPCCSAWYFINRPEPGVLGFQQIGGLCIQQMVIVMVVVTSSTHLLMQPIMDDADSPLQRLLLPL